MWIVSWCLIVFFHLNVSSSENNAFDSHPKCLLHLHEVMKWNKKKSLKYPFTAGSNFTAGTNLAADGNFTASSEVWSITQVLGVIEQFGLLQAGVFYTWIFYTVETPGLERPCCRSSFSDALKMRWRNKNKKIMKKYTLLLAANFGLLLRY